MNNTNKLKAIDAILAALPKIECQRKCARACGPILMSALERRRIMSQSGIDPYLPLRDLRKALDKDLSIIEQDSMLSCPLLKIGQCSVYSIRPAICWIFGLVKRMTCPHGCVPERWLTDAEAGEVLWKVGQLGG